MKFFLTVFIVVLSILPSTSFAKPKVAMLISGYGTTENPHLSYDLEELAQAYLVLNDNGVDIDIISPKGGSVLVKNNKDDLDYIQTFKKYALTKLKNTLSSEQAVNTDYDALFIVGGDGAMFDLPSHKQTQAWITRLVNNNKVIAAVCHGPAALVDIKLDNGEYFVSGKQVNGFTRIEDLAFKKENIALYPFVLQTKLEERNAHFVHNAPMLPFVAVDKHLITAQNPMSVAMAADALVLKLGLTPKTRKQFKDEATLNLVAKARTNGAYLIDIALATEPDKYNMNYLALYGFYAYGVADSEHEKRISLKLKEQIGKHFRHPKYMESLISAYLSQNLPEKAKAAFETLKLQFPKHEISNELMTKLAL